MPCFTDGQVLSSIVLQTIGCGVNVEVRDEKTPAIPSLIWKKTSADMIK